MREWIIVAVLYLFGMGVFRMLGGISAAGEVVRRWGRSCASQRQLHGSASS